MNKLLFISGFGNNYQVKLKRSLEFKHLYLVQYTLTDVPVTASIPNSPHYHLVFEHVPFNVTDFITNDNIAGIPLQLNGNYTNVQLQQPMPIVNAPCRGIQDFRIKFLDESGAEASLSDWAFWFHYE